MVGECWTIIAIIVIMSYMFMRARRTEGALSVLPLVLVPLCHVISGPVARLIAPQLDWPVIYVIVGINMLALVVACLLFGLIGSLIADKVARRCYIFVCGGFSIVLCWVLLYNAALPR